MKMVSITTDIDIDPWDVIDEVDEEELADYLRKCDWYVTKIPEVSDELNRDELIYLIDILSNIDGYQAGHVREKLLKLRYM